jgi:hypothetical protein
VCALLLATEHNVTTYFIQSKYFGDGQEYVQGARCAECQHRRIQIRTGALRQRFTQSNAQSSEEDEIRELIENLCSVKRKGALHVGRIPQLKTQSRAEQRTWTLQQIMMDHDDFILLRDRCCISTSAANAMS